jgi:hypothetical protein
LYIISQDWLIGAPDFTEELGQAISCWITVTQQPEEIGHQLGRIKAQYAEALL